MSKNRDRAASAVERCAPDAIGAQGELERVPEGLADLALLNIDDVCSALRMSKSWLYDEVKSGRFPSPLRHGPRCSRWRVSDVRDYLRGRQSIDLQPVKVAVHVVRTLWHIPPPMLRPRRRFE